MSISLPELITWTKKINLLYVEDNQDARNFTLEMLARFFDNISVAENGVEGLKKFRENKIDLILTDINMPNMSGIEMVCEIKKSDANVIVLLLSAHNEQCYFDEASRCDIPYYLPKPLSLNELIKILNALLSSKALFMEKE